MPQGKRTNKKKEGKKGNNNSPPPAPTILQNPNTQPTPAPTQAAATPASVQPTVTPQPPATQPPEVETVTSASRTWAQMVDPDAVSLFPQPTQQPTVTAPDDDGDEESACAGALMDRSDSSDEEDDDYEAPPSIQRQVDQMQAAFLQQQRSLDMVMAKQDRSINQLVSMISNLSVQELSPKGLQFNNMQTPTLGRDNSNALMPGPDTEAPAPARDLQVPSSDRSSLTTVTSAGRATGLIDAAGNSHPSGGSVTRNVGNVGSHGNATPANGEFWQPTSLQYAPLHPQQEGNQPWQQAQQQHSSHYSNPVPPSDPFMGSQQPQVTQSAPNLQSAPTIPNTPAPTVHPLNPHSSPMIQTSSTPFDYPKIYSAAYPGPRNDLKRYPPLVFPHMSPPRNLTHYHGAWVYDHTKRKAIFRRYRTVADANTLPVNVPNIPSHWIGRHYPNGHIYDAFGQWIPLSEPDDSGDFFEDTPPRTGYTPTTMYTTLTQPSGTFPPPRTSGMFSNLEGTSPLKKGLRGLQGGGDGGGGFPPGDNGNSRYFRGGPGGPPGGGGGGGGDDGGGDGGDDGESLGGASDKGSTKIKRFYPKPDPDLYPILQDNANFDNWFKDFMGQARAQGFDKLFNPWYIPKTSAEMEELSRMNSFFYAVFQRIIKTTLGKTIVKKHFEEPDCFEILKLIREDAHRSQEGKQALMDLLGTLITTRFNPTRGHTATSFVIKFDELLTKYNDANDEAGRLQDQMQKTLMQNSVSRVKVLNDIRVREYEKVCLEGMTVALRYAQYFDTLKQATQAYDLSVKSNLKSAGRRANVAMIECNMAEHSIDWDGPDDPTVYDVYNAQGDPSTRLPDFFWDKLTVDGKRAWHKNSPEDKRMFVKFLQQPTSRGPPAAPPRRQANQAIQEQETETDPEPPSYDVNKAASGPTPSPSPRQPTNAAPQSKRNDSHPGDIRAMTAQPKQGPKSTRQGNTVTFASPDFSTRSSFAAMADKVDTYTASYWAEQEEVPLTKRPSTDVGVDRPDFG